MSLYLEHAIWFVAVAFDGHAGGLGPRAWAGVQGCPRCLLFPLAPGQLQTVITCGALRIVMLRRLLRV